MLLGFPDKLRLATLLVDDIRPARAYAFKGATVVRWCCVYESERRSRVYWGQGGVDSPTAMRAPPRRL